MYSLIAGILIFISSVYLGIGLGSTYKNKLDFYEELLFFINFCNAEITYYSKTIDEIINKYKQNNESNRLFGIILKEKECAAVFEELIIGIKNLDKESQKNFIEMQTEKVKAAKERANKNWDTKGKLYRRITPLIGLVILILLI